ncbi:MAG TPA: RodZ domain-containing protein [Actinospica sp.]|jgi:cytoskeletal protein RodZ|nr:RodZ domain-containing protein [Actinospica sp.]
MTEPREQQEPASEGHRAIGELLQQARIRRRLTAQDVSEHTRITPQTLRLIEAGRFDECGGDVYARGHLRAYAQAVGVDPEPLLEMYGIVHLPPLTKRDLRKPRTATPTPPDSDKPLGSARKDARQAAANRARAVLPTIVPGAVPSLVPMAGATPPPDVPALRQPRRTEDYTDADSGSANRLTEPEAADGSAVNEAPAAFLSAAKSADRSGPNWSLALLGAIGAVGLVAAVQLWPHDASASTGPSGAASHAVPQQTQTAAPEPATPAVPPPSPAAAAPKAPVDLKITTKTTPVWVGVTNAAGQQLYWNVLNAGQTKEFTDAARLDVTVGDAAGVALQFNGKNVPLAGSDGEVLTTSFDPSGQI